MLQYKDSREAIGGLAASQHRHGWCCSCKRFQAGFLCSNSARWATDNILSSGRRRSLCQAPLYFAGSSGLRWLGVVEDAMNRRWLSLKSQLRVNQAVQKMLACATRVFFPHDREGLARVVSSAEGQNEADTPSKSS